MVSKVNLFFLLYYTYKSYESVNPEWILFMSRRVIKFLVLEFFSIIKTRKRSRSIMINFQDYLKRNAQKYFS